MLLRTIERFMREHNLPATTFGRMAVKDPCFVIDLRCGRISRAATELRVRAWMDGYQAAVQRRAGGPQGHAAAPQAPEAQPRSSAEDEATEVAS